MIDQPNGGRDDRVSEQLSQRGYNLIWVRPAAGEPLASVLAGQARPTTRIVQCLKHFAGQKRLWPPVNPFLGYALGHKFLPKHWVRASILVRSSVVLQKFILQMVVTIIWHDQRGFISGTKKPLICRVSQIHLGMVMSLKIKLLVWQKIKLPYSFIQMSDIKPAPDG